MAEPYPADNPPHLAAPQLSRLTGAHAVLRIETILDMITTEPRTGCPAAW
jgi:hypothetical protein